MARIVVLRVGHRFFRDSRVTTHVCLTARALGADGVIIADREDKAVEATIKEVGKRFGGNFSVESGKPWKKTIREWKEEGGKVVHLTAYGLKLPHVIDEIGVADEDIGHGDITTDALVDSRTKATGQVVCKERAVIAGLSESIILLKLLGCEGKLKVRDGQEVSAGTIILEVDGSGSSLLKVERVL